MNITLGILVIAGVCYLVIMALGRYANRLFEIGEQNLCNTLRSVNENLPEASAALNERRTRHLRIVRDDIQ